MPAFDKTLSKKKSLKSAKPALTPSSKRKVSFKDDSESKVQAEDRIVKKSKGKGRPEVVEEPISKAINDVKKSDTKKRVETKEKEAKVESKVKEVKPVSESEKKIVAKGKGHEKVTTKRKKAPTPSPGSSDAEAEETQREDANEDEKQDELDSNSKEEDAPLHGFSSESDSSDEDEDIDKAPIDVGKLPTVAKDDATVKRKLEKAKRAVTEERGVLYLGRIPHGFYEDQMRAYFSQFGDVTRIRLSRNKKTGRSRHYGFIEFKSAAVAQIVAETMDNYLLMGHLLQCKIVPKEEIHPELWIGANRKFRKVPTERIERLHQNKARTNEDRKKVERRLLKRQRQKKRKLQAVGIDYDIEPVSYVSVHSSKKAKQSAL